jgi:hypothetical protein
VTGTSSKSTGAWISDSSNGTTVTYSASNPTKEGPDDRLHREVLVTAGS